MKGKFHLKNLLKDVFGFAECHEKATYGLGYKLTLTRNRDDAVIDKAGRIADGRVRIYHNHCYVPHYAPSIEQQNILSSQILKKMPKELRYVERSLFFKGVKNQILWNFYLGSQENMNVPIRIVI